MLNAGEPYASCGRWRDAVLAALIGDAPDLVVISSYGAYGLPGAEGDAREKLWAAGLESTVSRLRDAGSEVLVIADTPRFLAAPGTCAAQFPMDLVGCAVPESSGIDHIHAEREKAAALAAGAEVEDFTRFLCDGERCPIIFDDLLVYRDLHHLSVEAVHYLAPELSTAITRDRLNSACREPPVG